LKAAVQASPAAAGMAQANWSWKVVRQFMAEQLGVTLSRSSCWNYLRRLGFVWKRPKKRLLKADAAQRAAFVANYAALRQAAEQGRATIFFVDEAHFRADVEVRNKWVLRGAAALVDSTSPSFGDKATYYSGVCLETGAVEAMPVTHNCTAETSVAFLQQLRAKYTGPLVVIWDNGPAHRGAAIRTYLATPDLNLRLVTLPPYSPDFNPDEAIWDWARQEVTANRCFGTAANVRQHIDAFFAGLAARTDEVISRCRRELQSLAKASISSIDHVSPFTQHVDPTLDSV
jgi:transposase